MTTTGDIIPNKYLKDLEGDAQNHEKTWKKMSFIHSMNLDDGFPLWYFDTAVKAMTSLVR